ncbi:MAG: HD domain-containing protein [Ktedonobacteraceae bacterium]
MQTVQFETEALASLSIEIEQRFAAIDDLAHGWEHVQRVYSLALYLAEQEGANRFIVGMAALMHDLGRAVASNTIAHHADISVTLALELLSRYGIPADTQEAILHAIVAHSFSRGVEAHTLEARVVRDADRLDGLGAVGILRWAITGSMRRNAQTRTYHPEDPFAEQHTPNDRLYMLDHFFTKLLQLSSTMTTDTGRALAQQRTAFMQMYLDELKKELEVCS